MSDEVNSIIRKVQALLNRTVSRGASKEEMDTAIALAHRLMEKYSLSFEDCKVEDITIRETDDILIKTKNTNEFIRMAIAVAHLFHCRIIVSRKYANYESKRRSTYIRLVGESENTRFVEFLLTEIFLNVTELCHIRSQKEGHTMKNALIEKYSFERGYFEAVMDKCYALVVEKETELKEASVKNNQNTGTALIVLDTAVEDYMTKREGLKNLTLKYTARKFSASSYASGRQEGQKQSLDRRVSKQSLRLSSK